MRSHKKKGLTPFDKKSTSSLPEGYVLKNGLLIKSDTVIGIASSEIIDIAAEGFLHTDENEEYKA